MKRTDRDDDEEEEEEEEEEEVLAFHWTEGTGRFPMSRSENGDEQIKDDELSGTCIIHGRNEKYLGNFDWKT
jgi:hypothetical protein